MQEAPGGSLLKVTGILLIIFGGIGLISSLITIIAIPLLLSEGYGSIIILSVVVSTIISALNVIAGILGVKNSYEISKAGICKTFGIILIVIQIINSIFSFYSNSVQGKGVGMVIFSLIIGLILPILYFLGASKNINASAAQ